MDAQQPPICERSATRLAADIRAGTTTATEAVDAYLSRINEKNDTLNAYITVIEESAREAARAADAARTGENDSEATTAEIGPLHGVPVALKDLRAAKQGVRHTFGSKLFATHESEQTAAIVKRLEAAGAIVLGKTNVPEFGHKIVTQNELGRPTASPVDSSLNAGGSSGGSASAIGAGLAALATGSDAGGSIRIPATCCGVFGLKPSFGLVPVDLRPNAFGRSRHHTVLGPLSRTVEDAALMMDVIAGPHPADPTSVPVDIDFRGAVGQSIADVTVAYSPAFDVFPVDSAVERVVEDALTGFERAGAAVETVEIGHEQSLDELTDAVEVTFATAVHDGIAVRTEATGIDLLDHTDEITPSLRKLAELGEQFGTADVATTGLVRTRVFDAIQSVLSTHDVLVVPTLGRVGFGLDEDVSHRNWDAALTWPFNWTGHPAASVPAGTTEEGHPVGLQIVGRRYEDDTVLAASAAFEAERPWLSDN